MVGFSWQTFSLPDALGNATLGFRSGGFGFLVVVVVNNIIILWPRCVRSFLAYDRNQVFIPCCSSYHLHHGSVQGKF